MEPPLITLPTDCPGTGSACSGTSPRWVKGGGPTERSGRYCQTNTNSSQFWQARLASVRAEAAPLGERGGATLLVGEAVGESAFGAEVVVDGPMDKGELLE